ncbi:hypothetical protein Taro_030432 [Colocasia esculenta]|uniref:Uncharacterized protein n=1 Tax=Colocasia esculenta TaxID=4460 RepID=A0A843VGB6_COLES|nr:hypothetical protein [Colocasia esculenta]
MSLQLGGVMWRSSWGLGSCGSTTRRTSSSPVRLLGPAQTADLKAIKDRTNLNQTLQGLYPWKEGQLYVLTQVECLNSMQYTQSIKRSPASGLNTGFLEEWDFFNPKAPCVNIRLFWTAIQEHVLSLPDSGADPVNVMAR